MAMTKLRSCPAAVLLLLFLGVLRGAEGACSQFGHSCFGAHGKRSGGPTAPVDNVLPPEGLGDYDDQGSLASRPDEYLEVLGSRSDEYVAAPGSRLEDYSSQANEYYDTSETELRQKIAGDPNGNSLWSRTKALDGWPRAGADGELPLRMSPRVARLRPRAGRVLAAGMMQNVQRAGDTAALRNFKNWLLGVMQDGSDDQHRRSPTKAQKKMFHVARSSGKAGPQRHQY